MLRKLAGPAALFVGLAAQTLASPGSIPATLKTLESVLSGVVLPGGGTGGGMQPLHTSAAAADALLRSLDKNGLSGAAVKLPDQKGGPAETGLVLGRHKGYRVIAGSLPNSPAAESHLRENDRLISIGDVQITAHHRLDELEKLLQGKVDDKITVRVLQSDGKATAKAPLTLKDIRPSLEVRELPGAIGFVRLGRLSTVNSAEYRLRIRTLLASSLIGVVLDLRGAQGGTPADATSLLSPFLAGQEVGAIEGPGSVKNPLRVSGSTNYKSHLVVLISPATSGAAEIAASVLQSKKRAVLLGGPTQGRALSYKTMEQGGVFLTVPDTVFTLPSGAHLTGRGVTPDIQVKVEPISKNQSKYFGGQLVAFAEGKKWEPPKEKTKTDIDLETAMKSESSSDDEEDEDKEEDDESTEDSDALAPKDPFHDYPLLKRFDPRLVRSVHLLTAANIFFGQSN